MTSVANTESVFNYANKCGPQEFIQLYLFILSMCVVKLSNLVESMEGPNDDNLDDAWISALKELHEARPELFYFLIGNCLDLSQISLLCKTMGVPQSLESDLATNLQTIMRILRELPKQFQGFNRGDGYCEDSVGNTSSKERTLELLVDMEKDCPGVLAAILDRIGLCSEVKRQIANYKAAKTN